MDQDIWFSVGGERVREALHAGFAWCQRCTVVTSAPPAGTAVDAFWRMLEGDLGRVTGTVLTGLELAEPAVIEPLRRSGRLRRPSEGSNVRGHWVWFERDDEVRFLLAHEAIGANVPEQRGVWL